MPPFAALSAFPLRLRTVSFVSTSFLTCFFMMFSLVVPGTYPQPAHSSAS